MTVKPERKKLAFMAGDPGSPASAAVEVADDPHAYAAPPKAVVPPHRANRKVVQLWLPPEAYRQLKLIGVREDQSMQVLLLEALDDFFQKRGEHRIART